MTKNHITGCVDNMNDQLDVIDQDIICNNCGNMNMINTTS